MMTSIKLKDIIQTEYALSHSSAKAFLRELLYYIPFRRTIIISFEGISSVSSSFIHDSLGALYVNYKKEADDYLIITDINNDIWNEKID
ncbi:MAG TPA: DUF4325 domain-containing protein [Chitinophagaceae bacterium]|nr:DUF4325 domain-containing protein [Chitinophagaceae bacterium]